MMAQGLRMLSSLSRAPASGGLQLPIPSSPRGSNTLFRLPQVAAKNMHRYIHRHEEMVKKKRKNVFLISVGDEK